MPIVGIIAAILSALGAVAGVIVDTGKAVLDTILSFFQTVFSLLNSFIQSAPMPMKVIIFLFFILSFGNAFSNFFLGTRYMCDGNDILYYTDNLPTALSGMFKSQFQGLDTGARNEFIHENYQLSITKATPTNVRCIAQTPKLLFYSVNILDYKLWMLILLAVFGIPLIMSYYRSMGVVGR